MMGVDDHRGKWMMKGDHGLTKLLYALTWGTFDHVSRAPRVKACNYYQEYIIKSIIYSCYYLL